MAAAALPAGSIPTDHLAAPFRSLFGSTWPARSTWIVAVQLDTGRRVVFGRDQTASLPDAVRASCAIPAFFEPVEIDGHRYVDGGVHSTTNADVVGDSRPDLVIVSAPMSAARGAARGVELPMRQFARLSLASEVAGLRGRRIPVVVFQPTASDLEVMSGDALDQRKVAPVCERVQRNVGARLAGATSATGSACCDGDRVADGDAAGSGDQRRHAEVVAPLASDRAQHVEVAVDAAGLRPGRHDAAVDLLDDLERRTCRR